MGARLAISDEPCLNPKKKKSPKYETLRNLSVIPGRAEGATPNPGRMLMKEDGFRAPARCAVPGMTPMVITL